MWRALLLLLALPAAAQTEAASVVATRDIAVGAIVSPEDVTLGAMAIPNAIADMNKVVGHTVVSAVSAGRALRADQITQALWVARNARITLAYRAGGLEIRTEGRALSEGGAGDVIEIMNLSSRSRVLGRVAPDGTVVVTAGP
jgi:flagella basal body P-ring formation protein FlgA